MKKEHSLVPYLPQFLREGDRPLLGFILHNKKKTDWTGSASLSLQDASNQESVDGWFMNSMANQYFTIDSSSRHEILFPIEVPFLYNRSFNWKLRIESAEDSISENNLLPIISWPYEDSVNEPMTTVPFIKVEKKILASTPLERGQKIVIEILVDLKKKAENVVIEEAWAAGLVPEKTAIQVPGLPNKNFSEALKPQSRTIKFPQLAAGTYLLRYYAVATYPGVFNQPPTFVYLNGGSTYAGRSSYQKLDIE